VDERRTGWLFLLILGAQLALLASGVPAEEGEMSLLESVGLRLVGPLARVTAAGASAVEGLGARFEHRQSLRQENELLRSEVERLRLEVTRLQGIEDEALRLAAAVGHARSAAAKLRYARVVYLDRASWFSTLILYAGGSVEPSQPVLAAEGLVGRVVHAAGPYARVQLLTDSAAAVGALLEGSGRQGLARGAGGGRLELDYVPLATPVAVGERVLTAGIDGVYPAGILVGTVAEVLAGDELFFRIRIAPAVDFGTLQHVYLLDRQRLPEELRPPPSGAGP
jgi:rod shape-determining protein MreC